MSLRTVVNAALVAFTAVLVLLPLALLFHLAYRIEVTPFVPIPKPLPSWVRDPSIKEQIHLIEGKFKEVNATLVALQSIQEPFIEYIPMKWRGSFTRLRLAVIGQYENEVKIEEHEKSLTHFNSVLEKLRRTSRLQDKELEEHEASWAARKAYEKIQQSRRQLFMAVFGLVLATWLEFSLVPAIFNSFLIKEMAKLIVRIIISPFYIGKFILNFVFESFCLIFYWIVFLFKNCLALSQALFGKFLSLLYCIINLTIFKFLVLRFIPPPPPPCSSSSP